MTDRIGKKRIGRIIAVALLAMTLVVGLIPNQALAAETKIADAATISKYTESLGDDASTEYAGRIWTDKSVYADKEAVITLKTGDDLKITNDSDFLVTYSALATSETVSGNTQAPVDVVFVIDTSGSMTDEMSSTDNTRRIVSTVEALNAAIDSIMKMNEYTRVGVVAFADRSAELLPLGRYEKGTRTTGSGWNQTTITDYFSLGNSNGTLYIHAKKENTNQTVTGTRSVTGGTNIQRGIYEGMNMLATEDSITASIDGAIIQRVPSIILLSDGAPTYSSNSSSWWAPENNNSDGPGGSPYYGNGMKALMTGAFMKEAVNRNYEVTGTAMETTMYTIGMGIKGLANTASSWGYTYYTGEQDLAYMTLNPKAHWAADNDMAEDIVSAWNTYTKNDGTPTVDTNSNETYIFRHPTGNQADYDIDEDADALKNLVDAYYDADSATAVTQVFQQIVANIAISAPEVPTEMKHLNALETGFIYYTDPIGEYMEVKAIKGIIYDGVFYPADADGKVSAIVDTELYGKQNLSNVDFEYEGTAGVDQKIKINIPAALIPLRINTVELNPDDTVKSHTNNGSWPIRVIYEVGLVDKIGDDELVKGSGSNAVVDTSLLSKEYLAAHTDSATGNVNFYSNLYEGNKMDGHDHTVGNATVEFEPAHTNPFYYMQKDDPIYKKVGNQYQQVNESEGLADDGTYYYINDYYHGVIVETEYLARTGAQLKQVEITTDSDGNLYRAAGSPRLNRILEFAGNKDVNATNTADDFYYPTFRHADGSTNPADGRYVIYLGNNGKLSITGTGALEISKTVDAAEGLEPKTTEFEFTVDFNGTANLGEFDYEIVGTETTGTIKDGGKLILKDGQTARITGLAPGTTYVVEEKDYTDVGFTTTQTGGSGTIAAGATSEADFINTYKVKEIVYPPTGDEGFVGEKTLSGRAWESTDKFQFLLTPYDNAPLPANYDTKFGVTVTAPASGDTASFDFGKITFTEPGVYRYTVVEREPESSEFLPGMTYSRALYRVEIVVTDKGDGTLNAESDIQKMYTDDATPLFTYDSNGSIVIPTDEQDSIEFTNTYKANSVTRVPVATKKYTDHSGGKPLESGMFTFKLEALGYCVGAYSEAEFVPTIDIPMPEDVKDGVVTTTNEGGNVTFPSVTFTQEDLKEKENDTVTYRYKITEVAGDVNGMTYDDSEYYANVVVSVDPDSDVLSVVATYLDGPEPDATDARIASFENEYNPEDTTATLKGTKTFSAEEGLTPNETSFEFKVEAANRLAQNVLPEAETTTVTMAKGSETFSFNEMKFKHTGVYVFNITETIGNAGGVTYDGHTTVATVTVIDADGQLTASVTYDNGDGKAASEAKFKNTYDVAPVIDKTVLNGTKILTGKPLVAGEFYFEVYDEQSTTSSSYLIPHEADTDGDGKATIKFDDEFEFNKPGTYSYLIKEQIPSDPVKVKGNSYDTTQYRYTVVVEDDGNGSLVIKDVNLKALANTGNVGSQDVEVDFDQVVFKNTYTPDELEVAIPPVTKVISGGRANALEADEFKFQLSLVEANPEDGTEGGIELPTETTVTNAADGTVVFDKITFSKAGTYKIKISEVIPADDDEKVPGITYSEHEITAVLRVVDDRNGNLSVVIAENTGGKYIVNEYNTVGTASLKIAKDFTGREDNAWLDTDKFDFEVVVNDADTIAAIEAGEIESERFKKSDEVYIIDGLTIDEKGEVVTIPEITFYKPDETYKFNIREIDGKSPGITYDGKAHVVEVTTADNSDGTMKVKINDGDAEPKDGKVTFHNKYDAKSTDISGHDELVIQKIFRGREDDKWGEKDAFKFTLAAADKVTEDAVANGTVVLPSTELTVTNANRAYPHFGNIEFHEIGTYKFVVTEQPSGIAGVTDDDKPNRYITVNVEDNDAGELKATVAEDETDSLTFINTYSTKEVELNGETYLKVTKKLTGRDWFDNDKFEFTLSVEEGSDTAEAIAEEYIEMPDDLSITVGKDRETAAFGDITFRTPGVYTFTIAETPGNIDNVTYDSHSTFVIATVKDNLLGELEVAVSYVGSMTFENVYTPEPIDVPIEGLKDLTGRLLADGEFAFTISKAEGTPAHTKLPAATRVTNVADKISFGNIRFYEAGVYKYEIKEESDNPLPGITYDNAVVKAEVDVTYNTEDGKLSAVVSYEKGDAKSDSFVFENTYTSAETDPVLLDLIKTVKESEGNAFTMAGDEFGFEIVPSPNNPKSDPIQKQIVKNGAEDANGEAKAVIFGSDVVFTEADTYIYTVHEVDSETGGITEDAAVYEVKVVVTDDESKAKLQAAVSITKDGKVVDEIRFENGYDPAEATIAFYGNKTLKSEHKNIEAGMFQFKLAGAEGAPMPEAGKEVVVNEATGFFQFGTITYDKPGTYEYVVSEVDLEEPGYSYDGKTYPIKVEVKDVEGVLTATTTGFLNSEGKSIIEFENGYVPGQAVTNIVGTKSLTVPEGSPRELKAGEFTFKLLNEKGETLGTATNDKDGAFKFADVPFEKAGTYNYKIVESNSNIPGVTDDPKKEIKVTIDVVDKDGQLQAAVSYPEGNEFINTYVPLDINAKIAFSGVKILEGKGKNDLEGGEFTFQLKDEAGKVIDEKSNDKDGAVNFDEIKYSAEGTHKYTISEVQGNAERITYDDTVYNITVTVRDGGEGYLVVDVQKDSEAIVFTNYYDAPEPKISINKTQAVNDGNATKEKLPVKAGDIVTYFISVANAEDAGIATLVTITDKVPEGLEVVEISEPGINREGVITWYISDLVGGESADLWFKVKVPAVEVDTEWENIAAVAYDDLYDPDDETPKDPDLEEETPEPVIIVEDVEPVLTVKKEASKTDVKSGDEIVYTITVENTGDGKAESVFITDVLPEGLIFIEADNDGVEEDGIVTWIIPELGAGKEAVVSVTVEVPEVTEDTEWANIATVTYGDNEPVPSEPEIIEVDVNPIVELIKEQAVNDGDPTTDKVKVEEDDLITYYLTVENNGAEDVTGIVITDKVPEGLELVEAGDGVEEDGTITWEIDELAAGESKVVYFIVRVPAVDADTDYENTAQLIYNELPGEGEDQDGSADPEFSNTVEAEQKVPAPEPKPEEPKSDAPDTGDNTNMMLWLILLGLSGAGLAGTAVYKRRRG